MPHVLGLLLFGWPVRLLAWFGCPLYTTYMRIGLRLTSFLVVVYVLQLCWWRDAGALALSPSAVITAVIGLTVLFFKDDVPQRSKDLAALQKCSDDVLLLPSADTLLRFTHLKQTIHGRLERTVEQAEEQEFNVICRLGQLGL